MHACVQSHVILLSSPPGTTTTHHAISCTAPHHIPTSAPTPLSSPIPSVKIQKNGTSMWGYTQTKP
ncbi:hypothetical protein BofuT4_uP097990.1 [Botrytis cinerea T4]|uniref:Uncharacterized protein n=1 Tax=Botryotinia fuckeliana (strain T4) TaxID=999810 RepID=G2YCR9_BOTF4|nr:hypothetical protein BofuT4_uP097990.1 [Botrytis cinerea T4]